MFVTFLLDVEDIISPGADDITRDVANILTDEGLTATFCVVGRRARQWADRRRGDVVAALSNHDVGYHTDGHSVHPTIAEYLSPCGWDDGVAAAVRSEGPGVRALTSSFGASPSCWGGPGNTWGPQVAEAARALGIPSVVYAHTCVPAGDIHRFAGTLAYPQGRHVGDHAYHDTATWERNLASLVSGLRDDAERGLQWREVFLGHPSRILHEEFWDGPSYSRGQNPGEEGPILPRRKCDRDLAAALENVRSTARTLRALDFAEPRTIREMNELCAGAREEPLTLEEQADAWATIEPALTDMAGWVIHRPGLDVSRIKSLTHERLDSLRRIRL